jgi:hypothetical protein
VIPRALSSTCITLLLTAVAAIAQAQQPWGAPQQGAPQQGTPPPPNPFGGMQAGGLAPPPPIPVTPPPGSGQTAQKLDDSKTSDSGRGLEWVWINVEGGFAHTGLRTFNTRDDSVTAGLVDTTASGGQIGVGAGARVLFFTVGARGRLGFYSPYRIFSVGGEAGMHIAIGRFDPHFDLGAGYTTLQGIKDITGTKSPMGIHGFYIRAGGGLDYYLARIFSLGLNASWELLGLTRPALSPGDISSIKANPALSTAQRAQADKLAAKDTSFGSALAITGLVGLHF